MYIYSFQKGCWILKRFSDGYIRSVQWEVAIRRLIKPQGDCAA